ncbi:hypothetical protein Scep_011755 [Stephania cephalantha]|uniref:Uncharacterized protein n=1 Tax=Stephania cephalantha TaxID=152367 RepID=A0AAP0JFZ8_9MAGN
MILSLICSKDLLISDRSETDYSDIQNMSLISLSQPPSPSSATLIIVVLRDSAASLFPLHRPLLPRRRHRPERRSAAAFLHRDSAAGVLIRDSAAGVLIRDSAAGVLIRDSAAAPHPRLRRCSPRPRLCRCFFIRDSAAGFLIRHSSPLVSSSVTPPPLLIRDSAGARLIRNSAGVRLIRDSAAGLLIRDSAASLLALHTPLAHRHRSRPELHPGGLARRHSRLVECLATRKLMRWTFES